MTPETVTPIAEGAATAHADVVVGVPGNEKDPGAEAVHAAVGATLGRLYPSRRVEVLLLAPPAGGPGPPTESVLPALLDAARRLEASACALVAAQRHDLAIEWVRLLVSPILDDGFDYVCPSYVRGKYEGILNTAIVYPLTRALFGRRLRQPLGAELAISRRLAESLLRDEAWATDPLHAGADIWLVTKVLSKELKVCQSFLGRYADPPPDPSTDLSQIVVRVVGLLFHEMERHAAVWQRIGRSERVPTFGEDGVLEGEPEHLDVTAMAASFRQGYDDLRDLWAAVLPPATLLALRRISQQPAPSLRFDDVLWTRVVYDFAIGYRTRVMERRQLLASLTPLYLGWVASFVNEVGPLDGKATAERIERLCQAFEAQKPYLISRWRWPDAFSP